MYIDIIVDRVPTKRTFVEGRVIFPDTFSWVLWTRIQERYMGDILYRQQTSLELYWRTGTNCIAKQLLIIGQATTGQTLIQTHTTTTEKFCKALTNYKQQNEGFFTKSYY